MSAKILTSIITASVAILLYFIYNTSFMKDVQIIQDNRNADKIKFSSSIWCHYDVTNNKICTMKNVFYIPNLKQFVFILTNDSVISGLKSKDDLKVINLSSVDGHNNMYMKLLVIISVEQQKFYFNKFDTGSSNVVYVDDFIYLLSRFKPDNIMHVIHDDILPLFNTYHTLCDGNVKQCTHVYRLMFIDNFKDDLFLEWYRIFSDKKPYNVNKLNRVTCFNKISVGLSRETVWFQYGFGIPQGPLQSATINKLIINKFNDFILNSFNIKNKEPSIANRDNKISINIVFFSRKINRKILNEDFIVSHILDVCRNIYPEKTKLNINRLDLSQNNSHNILDVVSKSNLLVGMHGSAMIYSIFLPDNAAIVELFPYGIQPQFVSPIRALSLLPGIFFNYLSWRNNKESNSITHPDRPALLGGITHLPDLMQKEINDLKVIPAVECCHNPSYLYRMFQDTVIDDSIKMILLQSLTNQKENNKDSEVYMNNYLKDAWFYYGPVVNITCAYNLVTGIVTAQWKEPYNIFITESLKLVKILYSITIKILTRVVSVETFSPTLTVRLNTIEVNSIRNNEDIEMWIKVVIDNIGGVDSHLYCSNVG